MRPKSTWVILTSVPLAISIVSGNAIAIGIFVAMFIYSLIYFNIKYWQALNNDPDSLRIVSNIKRIDK